MKRVVLVALAFLCFVFAFPASMLAAGAVERYVIDAEHSSVVFKIKHLGIGYIHGRFNNLTGKLQLTAANPADSVLTLSVMAAHVDTDIRDRDTHLRSPDFLDACQFPSLQLVSRIVRQQPTGDLEIAADLSLHGVSKPLDLQARLVGSGKDMQGNFRKGYECSFSIMRSDFGMTELLQVVGDTVEVTVSFEVVLAQTP